MIKKDINWSNKFIISKIANLLVLQLYMRRVSFYWLQIHLIQIGYICNELELYNLSLNHKNHFAKFQYLNFFHSHWYLYKIVYIDLVPVCTGNKSVVSFPWFPWINLAKIHAFFRYRDDIADLKISVAIQTRPNWSYLAQQSSPLNCITKLIKCWTCIY